jgi:hypothetical protein
VPWSSASAELGNETRLWLAAALAQLLLESVNHSEPAGRYAPRRGL